MLDNQKSELHHEDIMLLQQQEEMKDLRTLSYRVLLISCVMSASCCFSMRSTAVSCRWAWRLQRGRTWSWKTERDPTKLRVPRAWRRVRQSPSRYLNANCVMTFILEGCSCWHHTANLWCHADSDFRVAAGSWIIPDMIEIWYNRWGWILITDHLVSDSVTSDKRQRCRDLELVERPLSEISQRHQSWICDTRKQVDGDSAAGTWNVSLL